MEFLIFLLCIGFGYVLWSVKKLEERVDALSPKEMKPVEPVSKKSMIQAQAKPTSQAAKTLSPEKSAWEFKMGAWVYTAVGGIALLLGLGFLLRFAIENNLISPEIRVALGLALGAALIATGYWLEKRMRQFAHILIGTGLGALYLSIYAATMVYGLLPLIVGFIFFSTVTAISVILALKLETQSLAVFGMVGGYLTPFLLGPRDASTHAFFLYLLVLNGVMLAISWYKPWRILPGLSFVGTILSFFAWTLTNQQEAWFIPFTYLGLLFVEFLTRSIFRIAKGKLDQADYLLLCSNPIFFFSMMSAYQPENIESRLWAAFLALCFAIIHISLAFWRERVAFIGIGSIFLAITAPLYFKEHRWYVLAWSYEALVLGVLSKKLKSTLLEIVSHILFGLVAIILLTALSTASGSMAWLNQRILVFALAIGAFAGMAWYTEQNRKQDEKRTSLASAHHVLTFLLILIAVISEIDIFYQPNQSLWMGVAAVILGGLAIMTGTQIKSFALRVVGEITIGLSAITVIVEAISLETDSILLSPRSLALLICTAIIATVNVYLNNTKHGIEKNELDFLKPATWLIANSFLFFLVSLEALNATRIWGGTDQTQQVVLSVSWLVYGILLVAYGILQKSKLARGTAVALFGLVTAKVVLIDTAELDNFARFITFISLGGVLMVSGFLYNHFKARIES
jgi:uncharacterized membrane protein